MKQKCFFCGKEKDFRSYFKLYYKPYNSFLYKGEIGVCYDCRKKHSIEDIYKKAAEKEMKNLLNEFKRGVRNEFKK